MSFNIDDMTAIERPRQRRWVAVVAVLVPVAILAGASAWFVRAYVMPPSVAISEPVVLASADPASATSNETTGAPPPATNASIWPAVQPPAASVWDSVPLPGPSRQTPARAVEPMVAVGEPAVVEVPLPPPRPRFSVAASTNGPVPLPRPRPAPDAN